MRKYVGIGLVILMSTVVGCSTPQKRELSSTTGHNITTSTPIAAPAKARAEPGIFKVKITEHEYGSRWPFTVKEGVLICKDSGIKVGTTEMKEVLFTANKITYAVNGYAKGLRNHPDVRKIWANDLAEPGLKKNIGPIIDRALNLPEEPLSPTPAVTRPSVQRKTAGEPSPELNSRVQKYNRQLRQSQRFLAMEQVASQKQLSAIGEWEAAHGEIDCDKPYPRQLAKFASVSFRCLDRQEQSMKKAAAMLQVIKASSTFAKYYREGELAIADDWVPGRLIGTAAGQLRFIRRLD